MDLTPYQSFFNVVNTKNWEQSLGSSYQTWQWSALITAIFSLLSKRKLIEMGVEDRIYRILTTESISEVTQYYFNLQTITALPKHGVLPD